MRPSRSTMAVAIVAGLVLSTVCIAPQVAKAASASDEHAIEQLYKDWIAAFDARDATAIMKFYSPGKDLVVFDVIPPLQYVGADAYKKDFEGFFAGFKTVKVDTDQLVIVNDGKLAFTHVIERVTGTDTKGKPVDFTLRVTDCLRKTKGKWLILHEHVSAPVNLDTGKAELNLKP